MIKTTTKQKRIKHTKIPQVFLLLCVFSPEKKWFAKNNHHARDIHVCMGFLRQWDSKRPILVVTPYHAWVYLPIHEWLNFMVSVGKYTIRGCYGNLNEHILGETRNFSQNYTWDVPEHAMRQWLASGLFKNKLFVSELLTSLSSEKHPRIPFCLVMGSMGCPYFWPLETAWSRLKMLQGEYFGKLQPAIRYFFGEGANLQTLRKIRIKGNLHGWYLLSLEKVDSFSTERFTWGFEKKTHSVSVSI